jgi:hypothetical protein
MEITNTYFNFFYGLIAIVLLAGIFWFRPGVKGWLFYIIISSAFVIGGLLIHSYFLAGAAFVVILVSFIRFRRNIEKNRPLEIIFISDRDDYYLQHFLEYYRNDISKYFPHFDFRIEEEFLVALLFSRMETVGLIIGEIIDKDTLRICIDYMVPKHRNSQLAKTFYLCELQCIDFFGYRYLYIEPQSKAHNKYLERIGFRLVDGKYVNRYFP